MVTNENVSPDHIRYGDMVTDNIGRTFYAYSDAEPDQYNMYNVLTAEGKWYSYDMSDRVTVSYEPEDSYV